MGIYVGGTGSANLLDDFEEGVFTPRIGPDNNNGVYESGSGSYTKIGKQVHLLIHFINKNPNSFGSSTNVRIWNFPFTIRHSLNNNSHHATVVPLMLYKVRWSGSEKHCFYTVNNATEAEGLRSRDGDEWVNWSIGDWDINGFYMDVHLTYETDS